MTNTFAYQKSEALTRSALDAYYKTRIGTPRKVIICGVLMMLVGFLPFAFDLGGAGFLIVLFGAFFCLIGIKMRSQTQQFIKDTRRLVTDPTVTVSIDLSQITISSKNSTLILAWHQLSHVREVDDFLLLFTGTLLVAIFPLAAMSTQNKEFIRTQIQSSNKSIQGTGASAPVPDL